MSHSIINSDNILENLECAVILIDQQFVIQTVNIAAESLFCQSRRYLVGEQIERLIPLDIVARSIGECFSSNGQFTLREIAIPLPGDETLVDMTLSFISPLEDPAGSGNRPDPLVLIEVNSINRISRFMKEKNQMERQQSFRLMMRGLAHEIKNPLGGIRGAAQLLDREIEDPAHKELTDILIKEADRLTRLVDRVMGSREQLKLASLNIHEVLEHVAHLVSVKSDEMVIINRFYDPALPEIFADKEQLIQAVLNIVGNALESQTDARQARIGFVTKFERFITISRKMYRQVLRIRIWDDGPGVSEDMKEILFDPLITSRPEGTGLGLSITQEIIQRHQGIVQLEDYHGKTCFSIYLPYLDASDDEKLNSETV